MLTRKNIISLQAIGINEKKIKTFNYVKVRVHFLFT